MDTDDRWEGLRKRLGRVTCGIILRTGRQLLHPSHREGTGTKQILSVSEKQLDAQGKAESFINTDGKHAVTGLFLMTETEGVPK